MKIKMNIDKEQLKNIGNTGLRIGKAIVIEGTKAVVLKTAAKAITTSFEDGIGGVKKLKLDDVLGKQEEKQPKKKRKLFSKKEESEVIKTFDLSTEEGVDEMIHDLEVIKSELPKQEDKEEA